MPIRIKIPRKQRVLLKKRVNVGYKLSTSFILWRYFGGSTYAESCSRSNESWSNGWEAVESTLFSFSDWAIFFNKSLCVTTFAPRTSLPQYWEYDTSHVNLKNRADWPKPFLYFGGRSKNRRAKDVIAVIMVLAAGRGPLYLSFTLFRKMALTFTLRAVHVKLWRKQPQKYKIAMSQTRFRVTNVKTLPLPIHWVHYRI